jgi:hypothetical protein
MLVHLRITHVRESTRGTPFLLIQLSRKLVADVLFYLHQVRIAWQNLNIGHRLRTTDAVVIKLKPLMYRVTSLPQVHYSDPNYKVRSVFC